MAREKGQSDGIRKRGQARSEHTISLVGKKDAAGIEKVSVRRGEEKEGPITPPEPRVSGAHEEKAVLLKSSASGVGAKTEVFSVVDIPKPRPQKSVAPETAGSTAAKGVQSDSKDRGDDRVPVEEITAAAIDEDKVSSFFRKKPDAGKAEDDFYTSAGVREGEAEKKKRRSLFGGIAVGGGSLFVILILLSTVFARATVTITPKIEAAEIRNVAATFDAAAAEAVPKQKILPAAKLEFPKSISQEFAATGKKVADFKAKGTVKIYNAYNTSSQALVARTRFLTSDGVLYRLSSAVTVPAAKIENGKIVPRFVEAELVADSAGEGPNRSGEIKLTIPGFQGTPKYTGFYAIAASGFSGGVTGERTVVSAEDRTRASEEITKRAYAELEQESSEKIPPDFTVVDALRRIEITGVNLPSVDTVTDRFSASSDAIARLMVFRQSDVLAFLRTVTAAEEQTREILADSVAITITARSIDFAKGRADVLLNGTFEMRAVIPESDIIVGIAGRSTDEARTFLAGRPDLTSSGISFFPPWLLRAPVSPNKIKIRYQ